MPWVKLDDGFADHPKVERVGPLAAWLHVTALCYCARHLTDGVIPKVKATRLADVPQPAKRISALLEAGLWHDEGDVYRVHDYLDYQPAREQVAADRNAARQRMTKIRASRSSPEHPPNVPKNFDECSPVGSPYPVPSRPLPVTDTAVGQDIRASTNGKAPALGFDDFWDVYPAKKAKGAAKVAFAKAIRRAPVAVIVAGALAYTNDPNRKPDFTKYPATWLNADCWDDDYTPERTHSKGTVAALRLAARDAASPKEIAR